MTSEAGVPDLTDNGLSPPGLDESTRRRVFAALHDELARAVEAATARGVPREVINAYLDQRLSELRSFVAEDVQNDREDSIELRGIGG